MKIIIAIFLLFASSSLFAQTNNPNNRQGQLIQLVPGPEPAPTKVPIDPIKEVDIRRLLDVTGAKTLMIQRMASVEDTIRPLLTNSLPPGEYRAKLIKLFFDKFHSKTDPETLVEIAIPVYDKYLTDDDIKGLIDFYSTPLGKKVIQTLPQLMNECSEAGQKWGQQVGRQVMMEVLAEHPELKQALEQASTDKSPEKK